MPVLLCKTTLLGLYFSWVLILVNLAKLLIEELMFYASVWLASWPLFSIGAVYLITVSFMPG